LRKRKYYARKKIRDLIDNLSENKCENDNCMCL